MDTGCAPSSMSASFSPTPNVITNPTECGAAATLLHAWARLKVQHPTAIFEEAIPGKPVVVSIAEPIVAGTGRSIYIRDNTTIALVQFSARETHSRLDAFLLSGDIRAYTLEVTFSKGVNADRLLSVATLRRTTMPLANGIVIDPANWDGTRFHDAERGRATVAFWFDK